MFTSAFEDTVRFRLMAWILSFCFLTAFSVSGRTQTGRHNVTLPPGRTDPTVAGDMDEGQKRLAREMAKKANLERQAQLKNDTDRLLRLSQELKEYVDKSNENMLSLDVLKKAEEIEKLARSVKDKMKGPN